MRLKINRQKQQQHQHCCLENKNRKKADDKNDKIEKNKDNNDTAKRKRRSKTHIRHRATGLWPYKPGVWPSTRTMQISECRRGLLQPGRIPRGY